MRKYLKNIIWIAIDKLVTLVGGVVVTAIIARYLGPVFLGKLLFGVSLSAIPIAIAQWGGGQTIFCVASKYKSSAIRLISSTTYFRLSVYLIVVLIISGSLFIFKYESEDVLLIFLVLLAHIFLGLDLYQHYFNATLTAKVNAASNLLARLSSLLFRVGLLFAKANPFFFVIPYLLNNCVLFFYRRHKAAKAGNVRIKRYGGKNFRRYFLHTGFPFMLLGVLTIIYLKVNDIFLATLIGFRDLAIFNVGILIASAWTFVPLSVGLTLISKPLSETDLNKKSAGVVFVLLVMIFTSLPIILIIYLFGDVFVYYAFGEEYRDASNCLFVLSLASLIGTLNLVSNRVIGDFKNGGKYLVVKSIVASIVAIPLSYSLIVTYGIYGASVSVLIMEILSFSVLNYFFDGAYILKVHLRVLNRNLFTYANRYR